MVEQQIYKKKSLQLKAISDYCSFMLKYLSNISDTKWSTYFRPISKELKEIIGMDLFQPLSKVSEKITEIKNNCPIQSFFSEEHNYITFPFLIFVKS